MEEENKNWLNNKELFFMIDKYRKDMEKSTSEQQKKIAELNSSLRNTNNNLKNTDRTLRETMAHIKKYNQLIEKIYDIKKIQENTREKIDIVEEKVIKETEKTDKKINYLKEDLHQTCEKIESYFNERDIKADFWSSLKNSLSWIISIILAIVLLWDHLSKLL